MRYMNLRFTRYLLTLGVHVLSIHYYYHHHTVGKATLVTIVKTTESQLPADT